MMNLFVPTRKVWVIVANRQYEKKREISGFENKFSNIPEVTEDVVNVKKGMLRLGAIPGDIKILEDASYV